MAISLSKTDAINPAPPTEAQELAEEALRQKEGYLNLVFKDGFWDWDVATGVLQVNRHWAEMLDYRMEEIERVFDSWEARVHPDDRQAMMLALKEHLEGHTSLFVAEYRMRNRSGGWKWVVGRGRVVAKDALGKPMRMIGTHTDITERRQAEDNLRKAHDTLELRVQERTAELTRANALLRDEVAARQRIEEALEENRRRLVALSRRLVEVQEQERRHIAHELHDEIGQALTAVKIGLQAAQALPDPAASARRLGESITVVEDVLQQVRDLSLALRPAVLDELGLTAALRWLVDRQGHLSGLTVQVALDPLQNRLSSDVETTCFRIAQEALTNIARHAQARLVRVELRKEEEDLCLSVCDDGVGFDVEAAMRRSAEGDSLGLLGMGERALLVGGRCHIQSAPGEGTEIRAHFPMNLLKPHQE